MTLLVGHVRKTLAPLPAGDIVAGCRFDYFTFHDVRKEGSWRPDWRLLPFSPAMPFSPPSQGTATGTTGGGATKKRACGCWLWCAHQCCKKKWWLCSAPHRCCIHVHSLTKAHRGERLSREERKFFLQVGWQQQRSFRKWNSAGDGTATAGIYM